MIESFTPDAPAIATFVPDIADAVAAWWGSNPQFTPIGEYNGGDVLFRTAEPAHVFYGRREGDAFVQLADNETAGPNLENAWSGPAPVEFVEVPSEVAIAFMMQ